MHLGDKVDVSGKKRITLAGIELILCERGGIPYFIQRYTFTWMVVGSHFKGVYPLSSKKAHLCLLARISTALPTFVLPI